MIELHTWATPNGTKPAIMLEEAGLDYEVVLVDITKDEQFVPAFLAISPNGKIPTLVERDPSGCRRAVFESGAILIHIAEKTGLLLPASGPSRDETLEWLFWASSGIGPIFGQFWHFLGDDGEGSISALKRFTTEAWRLMRVLERRLDRVAYLAGEYSVADIAAFTWVHMTLATLRRNDSLSTPNIDRWLRSIGARPAVQRGLRAPKVRLRTHR